MVFLRGVPIVGQLLAPIIGVQIVVPVAVNIRHVVPWNTPVAFTTMVKSPVDGALISTNFFPALGLTSLQRGRDGSMQTVGLSLLTGQELLFTPDRQLGPADMARIAVRLIHALIEVEPLTAPHQFTGPEGETIDVVPMGQGRQLRVSVRR